MADTTPTYLLPWPELADGANIETAVKPLAERVETVIATFEPGAWIVVGSGGGAPAYQNSWVADASFGGVRYYKRKDRVYLEGSTTRATSSTAPIFTLPAGFRPVPLLTQLHFPSINVGTGTVQAFSIAATGEVFPTFGPATRLLIVGSFRAEA